MVFFHGVFNLNVFFGIDGPSYQEGFWFWEGRTAAIIFIVLVGTVSSLVNQRKDEKTALRINGYRGLRLIGLGLIVTLSTYLLARENTIWFGILHFLGISILMSIPLSKYRWLNVLIALILFAGYFPLRHVYTENYFGLIFGIMPADFSSYDHYALIPWLGFVLLGIALGNWVYANGQPLIKRKPTSIEKALAGTGKFSLWIYLLHQPILLGVMWLYFQSR